MAETRRILTPMPEGGRKKRVAAYARVSMDTEQLHHSLNAQVSYFRDKILANPEWEFVEVYCENIDYQPSRT